MEHVQGTVAHDVRSLRDLIKTRVLSGLFPGFIGMWNTERWVRNGKIVMLLGRLMLPHDMGRHILPKIFPTKQPPAGVPALEDAEPQEAGRREAHAEMRRQGDLTTEEVQKARDVSRAALLAWGCGTPSVAPTAKWNLCLLMPVR